MAVVTMSVELAARGTDELLDVLRRDRAWASADEIDLHLDFDDPSKGQVRAVFDTVEAAQAFREQVGRELVTSDAKSGFSMRATERPELLLSPGSLRLYREQHKSER